jgi:TonB-linked SusC/RagA family outer membrane protein
LLFFIYTGTSFAQNKQVKGKITDESGESLPGVTIKVKGTALGTTTNTDGNYSLNLPDASAVLVVSFIGYLTNEVAVGDRTVVNVQLAVDAKSLEELVVVGYGEQKKVTVTGSVATISEKEIKTTTNGNIVNMLAGKLPGLRVTQRTSAPGAFQSDFDIRGFGAPLVIIDGVPRDDFFKLDPNEIENVSVLKDASAAVYGVKGGNGVILITTKKGKVGSPDFNYSSTFGITKIANTPDLLDAYHFALLLNESDVNKGSTPRYSQQDMDNYRTGVNPSYDWYDLVIDKYASQQQHNLSARAATDKMSYFISLGYFDEKGIYKSGDINANKFNFRSNLTANLTKNLKATLMLYGIQDTRNEPSKAAGDVIQYLWRMKPTDSPFANNNPDYLGNSPDAVHPLAATTADIGGYNKVTDKALNGSFALDYKVPFVPGLKARGMYAYDTKYRVQKTWNKMYTLYNYDNATGEYSIAQKGIAGAAATKSNLKQIFTENVSETAQLSLNYDKTFLSSHNISALLLYEHRKKDGLGFNGSRYFSLDALDQLFAGDPEGQTITSTNPDIIVNEGIVGRLNYNYKERYLIEGMFRYDGSSNFAKGHRWGLFPAITGGWRLSEESFLKNKVEFLNNLKLRASYGKLGDDASSTYQFLTGYDYPGTALYSLDGSLTRGINFRNMPNENLTWYTNHIANIGLDVDLFRNKLHAEFDMFSKKREGLLATRSRTLPGTLGATFPQENLNSDLQKGFEVLLRYRNKIKDFNYSVSGNMSFTRRKRLYIEQSPYLNSIDNWKNNGSYRWNDIYWGYHAIGQFQTMEEIANSPIQDGKGNSLVLPGDIKYQDFNNDGIIDGNDNRPIGLTPNAPQIMFGFTLDASWKGFDVNALFQGATRFTVDYGTTAQLSHPLQFEGNSLDIFLDRWHKADVFDPNSQWVPGYFPAYRPGANGWNESTSDWRLRDATYLRLKSLQIGYTIPKRMLSRIGLKGFRIYANGFNLMTFSGLNRFMDPEQPSGTRYPLTKSYNIGLNITL